MEFLQTECHDLYIQLPILFIFILSELSESKWWIAYVCIIRVPIENRSRKNIPMFGLPFYKSIWVSM